MKTRAYKLFSRFCDLLAYAENRVADPDQAVNVLQTCMKKALENESAPDDEAAFFSWCCRLIDACATTIHPPNGMSASPML